MDRKWTLLVEAQEKCHADEFGDACLGRFPSCEGMNVRVRNIFLYPCHLGGLRFEIDMLTFGMCFCLSNSLERNSL
jgi:hypothetical protein